MVASSEPTTTSAARTAPAAIVPPPWPTNDAALRPASSRHRSMSARDTSKGLSSTSHVSASSMPSVIVGPSSSNSVIIDAAATVTRPPTTTAATAMVRIAASPALRPRRRK